MKMDKSTLVVFGAVILLGCLIIFGQPIIKSIIGGTDDEEPVIPPPDTPSTTVPVDDEIAPPPPPPPPAPQARKIYDEITELGKNPWDKLAYFQMDDLIKQQLNADLIKKKEGKTLEKYLNLQYIKTLNKAAKDFFRNSMNAGELGEINEELKRYASTEFAPNIRIMQAAVSHFYQLSGKKNEVRKYIAKDLYDEAEAERLFNTIKQLSAKDHLAGSPLVAKMKKESHEKLIKNIKDNRIEELITVRNYWAYQAYDESTTQRFQRSLEQLRNHKIIGSQSDVTTFVNREISNLEEHKSLDETLLSKARYDERTCAAICGQFQFYVKKCENIRHSANQANKDTIN